MITYITFENFCVIVLSRKTMITPLTGANRLSHIDRSVDSNLFPLNDKELTLDWARRTYAQYPLFNDSILSRSYGNDDDLKAWIAEAKQLMKEIKIKGIDAGRKEIVRVACHQYNMYLLNKTNDFVNPPQRPLNIREVLSIIGDPVWYNDEKTYKQDIIHHLAYGIRRKINNLWLIETEKMWMEQYGITYKYTNCKRITETRGFVYKLMNSTFSNSTIKMFKRVMLSNLGEYISVRDNEGIVNKINSGLIRNLTYQKRTFKNGKGIIITNLNHKVVKKVPDMNELTNNVNEWVAVSIKNGVVLEQILFNVHKIYQSNMQLLKRKASTQRHIVLPAKQQKCGLTDKEIIHQNNQNEHFNEKTGTYIV